MDCSFSAGDKGDVWLHGIGLEDFKRLEPLAEYTYVNSNNENVANIMVGKVRITVFSPIEKEVA